MEVSPEQSMPRGLSLPQLPLRQTDGSIIVGIQPGRADIALGAVGEGDALPAVGGAGLRVGLRRLCDRHHRAHGQGDPGPGLVFGLSEHVTEIFVEYHLFGQRRPVPGGLVPDDQTAQTAHRGIALIAVMGADLPVAGGGLLQHLQHHAEKGLVGEFAVGAGLGHQGADGGIYNSLHAKASKVFSSASMTTVRPRGRDMVGVEWPQGRPLRTGLPQGRTTSRRISGISRVFSGSSGGQSVQ